MPWFRRFVAVASLTCVTLIVAGCPRSVAVWVLPTSTDARLAFGIGDCAQQARAVTVDRFVVTSCAEERETQTGVHVAADETHFWEIASVSNPDSLAWLVYGEPPANYRTVTPPRPLVAGDCYYARVAGPEGRGGVYFRVTDAHRIIEVPPPTAVR